MRRRYVFYTRGRFFHVIGADFVWTMTRSVIASTEKATTERLHRPMKTRGGCLVCALTS